MIRSRKKRIIVGVCSIALSLCIVAGALLGIHAYREYYEEAIPVEGVLPRPDKIKVYYKDGEKLKTKRLTGDDIDLVYDAFEALLPQCTRAGTGKAGLFLLTFNPEGYLRTREKYGYMEFYYTQRKKISCAVRNPQKKDDPYPTIEDMFTFSGECDSVSINYFGLSSLSFFGCKNGEYFDNGYGTISFPQEAADAFWETVMSCVE